jgi:hypothetical protein
MTNTSNARLEVMVVVAKATENEIAIERRKMAKLRNSDSGDPRSMSIVVEILAMNCLATDFIRKKARANNGAARPTPERWLNQQVVGSNPTAGSSLRPATELAGILYVFP